MEIIVDKEGREVIVQLCDIALKQGGVQNLQSVAKILSLTKDKEIPAADIGDGTNESKKILKKQNLNEKKE